MTESRTNLGWDALLDLPATGAKHDRLTRALRAAIHSGRLPEGSALPPSRALAADLGCSRWVITQAYAQLVAEGYLQAQIGSATRVRWTPTPENLATPPATARPPTAPTRFDLTPGLPDLRAFPRARWGDALRDQARRVPFPDLGFPAPGGHPDLRNVLAEYLHRCRGVAAEPDDIAITTGVTDGAARLFRVLRAEGITRLAVEDPGWTRLHDVAREAGLTVIPTPVDDDGLRVADLEPATRAVLLTPAHQFPTGVTLTPERRAALVEWARRVDGLIIEDDYDSEFRYDHRPLGAIQGMCPQRVVLLGSVSKTLSPAVGIGWLLAPPRWIRPLLASGTARSGPPVLDQLAFAHLVRTGGYDRHLRSVRQRYRTRRAALLEALHTRLPTCRVTGSAAGLHLLAHLDTHSPTVVTSAAARGLRLVDLRTYQTNPRQPSNCLVLGYGNLTDTAIDEAVTVLHNVCAEHTGNR